MIRDCNTQLTFQVNLHQLVSLCAGSISRCFRALNRLQMFSQLLLQLVRFVNHGLFHSLLVLDPILQVVSDILERRGELETPRTTLINLTLKCIPAMEGNWPF